MSKKRKRNHGRHSGGGRVTPKGTRPGAQPRSDRPLTGSDALLGPNSLLGPDPLLGPSDAEFDDLDAMFDLDDDEFSADDPMATLVDGFARVDLDDTLMVELWAGELVGGFRDALTPASPWEDNDDMPSVEEFFESLIGAIADRSSTDPDFAQVLAALSPFLDGRARRIADAALARCDRRLIEFSEPVGSAVVEQCFVLDHETDDGHNIGLVARHPGSDAPHLIMTFVDVNIGGLARDIMVSDQIDQLRQAATADGLVSSPVDPAEAHTRLLDALRITDMTIDAPVADDFAHVRPLLEQLMTTLPAPETPSDHDPDDDEIDALVERMVELSRDRWDDRLTPERLRSTGQLVAGFMAHHMGRSASAWSPTRVEIFLCDYVPRKIAAPPETLMSLPSEMAALVPAAHQLAGWEDRHINATLDVIRQVTPEFERLITSPEHGSPGKQMLMRALAEGVDLEDPDQLDALVGRVNSMGGIDVFGAGDDISMAPDLPGPIDLGMVPEATRGRVADIDRRMVDVHLALLDPEHLGICRHLLMLLANAHADALGRGGPDGWAGGIPYAVCQVNKLFSGWTAILDVTGADIADAVEMSQATVSNRAKEVRALLDLDGWPPRDDVFRWDVRERYESFGRQIDEIRRRHGLDG